VRRTIEALQVMRDFFNLLGVAGSLMPGVAMATVLIVWHVMRRDPWVIDAKTLGGMLAESAAWTLPLLVLAATVQHAASTLTASLPPGQSVHGLIPLVHESTRRLLELPVATRLTIAIGAGLYEEMLFRLVGLALLHFILADLIALPQKWATVGAIVLSALAFAAYHQPTHASEWATYVLSGVYLGTVYGMRGFGIVVGTHALYDVLVLAVGPAITS
jgi:membrane protease YdiL (CAAX protease family)